MKWLQISTNVPRPLVTMEAPVLTRSTVLCVNAPRDTMDAIATTVRHCSYVYLYSGISIYLYLYARLDQRRFDVMTRDI